MIIIKDRRDCCGCTACASVCPYGAITMEPDKLGFRYPKVDEDKCVECGLCEKVCAFHEGYNRQGNFEEPLVYGCRHKDRKELETSQSGALATAIMQKFLEMPGVVYGVAYDRDLEIVHKRATSLTECLAFKGSKYVQSDLTGVFKDVFDDLKNGERVLFLGTPCQVAGLKSFIPSRYYDQLLLVDNVCHAVNSPAIWKAYCKWIEKKHKKQIVKTDFRNKSFGWHSHCETFTFDDNTSVSRETFKNLFYDHLTVRRSCSSCFFANLKRVSDITVGDFWGWENSHSDWNDNKGVSLALINSEKGQKYFTGLQSYLETVPSDTSECMQPQLCGPIEIDDKKLSDVEKRFVHQGFYSVAYKYGYVGFLAMIRSAVKLLKSICRRIGIRK